MITIPEHIKGLIFDCDGTLADTMPLHLEAWKEAYEAFGRECPVKYIDDLKGVPAEEIIEKYNKDYDDDLDPEKVADKKEELSKEKLKRAYPIDDVVETAKKYKGKLPMALASGGSKSNVDVTLDALGMKDFFDFVITSADDVEPKPAPDIFLKAAKEIGVEPGKCLVFEDGDPGIDAAKNAGMESVDIRKIFEGANNNYERMYDNYPDGE